MECKDAIGTSQLTLNSFKKKRTSVFLCRPALCVILIFLTSSFVSQVQAFSPTPEQIEQFKGMSPAEQQRLAKSIGVEIPAGAVGKAGAQQLSNPETVTPRTRSSQSKRQGQNRSENRNQSQDQRQKNTSNMTKTDKLDFENQRNADQQGIDDEYNANTQNTADEYGEYTDDEYINNDTVEEENLVEREKLEPFGYDLFAGNPTTFAPATDIPVPTNYVIGPGDSVLVQLYGKENSTTELVVSRDGQIQFPEIGPMSVNGLNFGELQGRINQLVEEQMIGVKASITMGALRSIRVFVLGEAFRPGSYTVSSLSTMTNALLSSGGIQQIGSLRNITLKRNGKIISTLDLYDLLLHGDTRNDKRLMPGDVLFIPPVQKTVAIGGEVRRPAIYEVKNERTMAELVKLAGGYSADAYPADARVARVNSSGNRTVLDIDLKQTISQNAAIQDGDMLEIPSVLEKLESIVQVAGHIHRPGYFDWYKGLRVSNVINRVSDLKPNPDLSLALIKREIGEERKVEFITFHLGDAIKGKQPANLQLQPRDELIVFEAGSIDRAETLKGFVGTAQKQHFGNGHPPIIEMIGEVKSPGEYPLATQMTVADALQLSGQFTSNAARNSVLLARQDPLSNQLSFIKIGDEMDTPEVLLQPRDQLIILPKKGDREELLQALIVSINEQSQYGVPMPIVNIVGAVQYPGDYPLFAGANVESLIQLAGGLKEEAYKLSGELSRVSVKESEDGYEVVHQQVSLNKAEGLNLDLKSRDRLIVKKIPEWGESIQVTLNGEVRFPGVYPVKRGETIGQLLERAGGLNERADPKGAIFLRESLKEKEEKMLEKFEQQLADEVAATVSNKVQLEEEVPDIAMLQQSLLEQVKDTEATGRLVFNLPGILNDKKNVTDVVLKDGDSITIPSFMQEISILGEVNFPTSHLYEKGISAGKYLGKSGGVTRKADKKNAYVIGRDGAVRPMYKWKFLWFGMKRKLQAGDTLIVPTDIDRLHPLTVWQKTSQILFQLATTAAALQTVGAI